MKNTDEIKNIHEAPFLKVETSDYVLSQEDIIYLLRIGKYLQKLIESHASGYSSFILYQDDVDLARRVYDLFCGEDLLKIPQEQDHGNIGLKINDYYIFEGENKKNLEACLENGILNGGGYVDGKNIINLRRQIVDYAREIFESHDIKQKIKNGHDFVIINKQGRR